MIVYLYLITILYILLCNTSSSSSSSSSSPPPLSLPKWNIPKSTDINKYIFTITNYQSYLSSLLPHWYNNNIHNKSIHSQEHIDNIYNKLIDIITHCADMAFTRTTPSSHHHHHSSSSSPLPLLSLHTHIYQNIINIIIMIQH